MAQKSIEDANLVTKIAGTVNGFDYEVSQKFVCGSVRTGEKSKYVNTLIIKNSGKVVLNTHWEGKESEAYLKMKSRDEVSWFIENQDIFTTKKTIGEKKKTCPYLIKAGCANKSNLQANALRVETISICDRCSLKMPLHWSQAAKDRAHIDILNGYILDFGICGEGPCPKDDQNVKT